jgi:hypothetical protein
MPGNRVTDVCYVNEQGEIICGESHTDADVTALDQIKDAIRGQSPNISDERLDLILRLITEVENSPLTDACIQSRGNDTVDSVNVLLAEEPPVMLLYRYVGIPADVMATYYTQQTKYRAAFAVLDRWKTLKPSC